MRPDLYIIVITCTLFWGASTILAFGQYSDTDFKRYTVKDGISDNNISCIAQDSRGYIWIGTEIGLNRFDGYQFRNSYQNYSGHLLPSSHIRKLILADSVNLIIVTTNGFQLMNTNTGVFQNYSIPDSTPFVALRNLVWDVTPLENGSFAVTTSSGFYVFEADGSLSFRHDAYGVKDIGNKKIYYGREIFSIPGNQLLIYIEEVRLAHYLPVGKKFAELNHTNTEWKEFFHPIQYNGDKWNSKNQISKHEFIFLPRVDSVVYFNFLTQKRVASPLPFSSFQNFTYESNVIMLSDSTFVVNGGYAGFYVFHIDRASGIITGGHRKFLEGFKINALFEDKDGRLWIGTTQGLLRQVLNPGLITTFSWPVGDFSFDGYLDGMRYKDKLYLSRYSRNVGLVIIDTATMEKEHEVNFNGLNSEWNEIYAMEMYHPDTFWFGSNAGLLWLDTKTNRYGKVADLLHLEKQLPLYHDLQPVRPDGFAWMCGLLNGQVARYDVKNRKFEFFSSTSSPPLPFTKIKSLAYDSYGDVWLSGHSLARWNNDERVFDNLITVYGGPNKYNDDINVMVADDNGSLWLHNSENGLLEYKIREKEFISYTMKDGLPSDVIRCLSSVADHTLWMGSHNHLTSFNTQTKKTDVFSYRDGLPDQKPISRKIITDEATKDMYMFYVDDVIRFPMHPPSRQDHGSGILLEEVIINSQIKIPFPSTRLQLKHDQNNLALHFTIIDFEEEPNYQFAYRLQPTDPWINIGEQRVVHLNNLSHGFYDIEIEASGRSGELRLHHFAFAVAAPFWKTAWFAIMCLAGLGIIVYWIYRSRIAQFRQRANVDKLLSQTEMKALHAQMNPHFIFNSLNSIREMILNNENKEASRYLSKFAHLIRVTLDQSGQSFITLRNTIDYLERYIEMEKIRNANFHFEITVDPALELDETIMPPMLIQPFIENAIWHGPTGQVKKINILLQFKKINDQLICIVEDNGIGIERSLSNKNDTDKQHHSVGISNIRSRIQLLNKKHNLQSSVMIEDKSTINGHHESGTRITLRMPLEIIEE